MKASLWAKPAYIPWGMQVAFGESPLERHLVPFQATTNISLQMGQDWRLSQLSLQMTTTSQETITCQSHTWIPGSEKLWEIISGYYCFKPLNFEKFVNNKYNCLYILLLWRWYGLQNGEYLCFYYINLLFLHQYVRLSTTVLMSLASSPLSPDLYCQSLRAGFDLDIIHSIALSLYNIWVRSSSSFPSSSDLFYLACHTLVPSKL